MSDLGPELIPSTPNAATVTQVVGLVRIVLAGLAGAGVVIGGLASVSDAQISAIVTALLTVGGLVVWIATAVSSWLQKNAAAKHAHQAAVNSAIQSSQATMAEGRPVAITVEPAKAP